MSTITVSLYLVKGDLKETSSNNQPPIPPQLDATTDIVSGDTIIWVLGSNSGISSIDSIKPKSSVLTFNPIPAAANNWTCVVGAASSNDPYHYTICYTPDGGNQICTDPKIKVNPGTPEN